MRPIRILLADDHSLLRSGIRVLLEQLDNVEVLAEAANGREAVELTRKHAPDVVLMDIAMPELTGLEATKRIRKQFPHVKVVLLSMYAHEEYVAEALSAGARGYILKNAGPAELELAVQAVARGESFLSPAIAQKLISGKVRLGEANGTPAPKLTPRQVEILQLIAEGNSTKDIARKLHLSVKTVETHRANLMDRLNVHDLAGLVRYAIRTGLIRAE